MDAAISRVHLTLELREKNNCYNMSSEEFRDIARLFCFVNCGHCDR